MEKVYKIESKALNDVKNVLEAEDIIGEGEKEINEFKRQGYTLRDARSLGMDEDGNFLYVKGDEEFFERNEEKIMKDGVKELKGEKKEEVVKAVEEEEENAVAGMGAIFG